MKSIYCFGHTLPHFLRKRLFGDREKFGLNVIKQDPCWIEWQKIVEQFYIATQRDTLGKYINHSGYKVMSKINLEGFKILEIGAGDLQHNKYWKGKPQHVSIVDSNPIFLEKTGNILKNSQLSYELHLIKDWNEKGLPFPNHSFDLIISFYCLEHLHPLISYIPQLIKILKPNGFFVGAIPCDGGLAWGLGRYLTSRKWLKKNSNVNPDKIICWEHPNYCDFIIYTLNQFFKEKTLMFWPFILPLADINLTLQFIYSKPIINNIYKI